MIDDTISDYCYTCKNECKKPAVVDWVKTYGCKEFQDDYKPICLIHLKIELLD